MPGTASAAGEVQRLDFEIGKGYGVLHDAGKVLGSASLTYLLLLSVETVLVVGSASEATRGAGAVTVPVLDLEVPRLWAIVIVFALSCGALFQFTATMAAYQLLTKKLYLLLNVRYDHGLATDWHLHYPSLFWTILLVGLAWARRGPRILASRAIPGAITLAALGLPGGLAWRLADTQRYSPAQLLGLWAGIAILNLPPVAMAWEASRLFRKHLCWPFGISVRVKRHIAPTRGSNTLRQRATGVRRAFRCYAMRSPVMLSRLFRHCAQLGRSLAHALRQRLVRATKPAEPAIVTGTLADLVRSRPALVAENAFLRQQLLILRRSGKRPRCTPTDRALLVLLASRLRAWRQALVIVQPETVLRWHRAGFRLVWRRRSRPRSSPKPKVAAETIALIREMAAANRLWGAERIRGELLKLGVRVAKTTVQRHMRGARPPRCARQPWAAFLRNHAADIWACDFLPVTDLQFRPVYAFFVIALATRRVVHVGVTRHPTDAWVAQQLREATPFGQRPCYLVRDRDSKYGLAFARVAAATGIVELRTAYRAPRQNAACERFLGSVRRECLDHILVLGEGHLRRVLREYVAYFNQDRPHQGLRQRIPGDAAASRVSAGRPGQVQAVPVLGGLHHAYRQAA